MQRFPYTTKAPQRLLLSTLLLLLLAACGTLQKAAAPTAVSVPSPTFLPATATAVPNATDTQTPPTRVSTATTLVQPSPTATPNLTPTSAPPTPTTPTLTWIRKQFGDAWSLEYPATWDVNEAGVHEGSVDVRGPYNGHTYEIYFFYPIFEQPVDSLSLDAWVAQELAKVSADQRKAIIVTDIIVAGTPTKKVLNFPGDTSDEVTHRAYIWRSGDKNPRQIVIQQVDGQATDVEQMANLFDRFLAGVAAPANK